MHVEVRLLPPFPEAVVAWPKSWPPPRVGDEISLAADTWQVEHVAWYPQGDGEGVNPPFDQPYVYVVAHRVGT